MDGRTRAQRRYGLAHDPVMLHCPGPFRRPGAGLEHEWAAACDLALSDRALRGCASGIQDTTIVTYSNYAEPTLLERGLAWLGFGDYVVLRTAARPWTQRYKLTLLGDWLAGGACRTEFLLCLDADDILFVNHPRLALERFRAAACDILFGATGADAPRSPECWEFECSIGEYRDPGHAHLNAGGFMGRARFIGDCTRRILDAWRADPAFCESPRGFSDQLGWRRMHRLYYPRVKIDWACSVFLRFDDLR
jgi:hypothetical protein